MGGCLLAIVVLGAILTWILPDLPRRLIEATLARQLAARVELGGVSFGRHQLQLFDLTVEKPADLTVLERLHIDQVTADGSFWDMFRGRFARLALAGTTGHLTALPDHLPTARAAVTIDALDLGQATLTLGSDPTTTVVVSGDLVAVGQHAQGELRLYADRAHLAPVLTALGLSADRLQGDLEELAAKIVLDGGVEKIKLVARLAHLLSQDILSSEDVKIIVEEPQLVLAPASGRLSLDGHARRLDLELGKLPPTSVPEPRLVATLTFQDDPSSVLVEAKPVLAAVDEARLTADWPQGHKLPERFDLVLSRLRPLVLWPDLGIDAELDLELHLSSGQLAGELTARARRLALTPYVLSAERNIVLQASGSTPVGDRWTGGPLQLEVTLPRGTQLDGKDLPPDLLPLDLILDGALSPEPSSFAGTVRLATPKLAVDARGEAPLTRDGHGADWRWRLQPVALADLQNLADQLGLDRARSLALAGKIDAQGRLLGPWARPIVSATVTTSELSVEPTGEVATAWRLFDAASRMELSWRGAPDAPLEWPELDLTGRFSLSPYPAVDLTLDAAGHSSADLQTGRVERGTVTVPDLAEVVLDGTWQLTDGVPHLTGHAELHQLQIADALPWWQRAHELALPWELEARGTVEAELDGELTIGRGFEARGALDLRDAGFTASAGARVLEGLGGRFELTAQGVPGEPSLFEARGKTDGFLILWDTLFGDFSTTTTRLDVQLETDPGETRPPWALTGQLELAEGSRAAWGLAPADGDAGLLVDLELALPDLGAVLQDHVRKLFPDRFEGTVLRGRLGGELHGLLAEGLQPRKLSGRLELDVESLAGATAEVENLRLGLPFDLTLKDAETGRWQGPPLEGWLSFDRVRLEERQLAASDTPLAIAGDQVALVEPLTSDFLGGTVTLERLALARLLGEHPVVECGLRWQDVEIDQVSELLGWIPLGGTLEGHLPRLRLTDGELEVDGVGEVRLFGGAATVRDISGSDILGRYPKITFSADIRDIDLEQLTGRFDFGLMTGTLEGSLAPCQLFLGVPRRCEARFTTVRRKGRRQTIGVRAVENLTSLASGQRTDAFRAGFLQFFKTFPYAGFGFDAHLEGDVLILRGLEKRGERELFLRGRWPLRLDIVNARPGVAVSLQSLLNRLRNLDLAVVTTGRPEADDKLPESQPRSQR